MPVEDKIDPTAPWRNWGDMLHHHPTAMKSILDRVEPATDHLSAIFRTRAIAKWVHDNGVQLCRMVNTQRPEQRDNLVGVHFETNPYASPEPVPGIGVMYIDPFLVEHPITWRMVDDEKFSYGGYLTDFERLAGRNDDLPEDLAWLAKIEQAEVEWFSNSLDAPVVVIHWEGRAIMPDGQDFPTAQWDATQEVLAMGMRERQSIDGFRKHGMSSFPRLTLGIPDTVRNWQENCNLTLRIHAASPALVAMRRAQMIQANTPAIPGDAGTSPGMRRL